MSERTSDRLGNLWAPRAFIADAWQEAVLLEVDGSGHFSAITPGVSSAPPGVTILSGPVVPGLVNGHSHAFQRAFVGLAERLPAAATGAPPGDDFWSWRERMYAVALRMTPAQATAVAAQLYLELLRGGYTQICEFHYLHTAEDGRPYPDPANLAWAHVQAAREVGLGLTMLPTLYERAGFSAPALRPEQRRFASTPAFIHGLATTLAATGDPLLNAGVAVHSLRAASPESMQALLQLVGQNDLPIHLHAAEQRREVEECVASTGARPIAWICQNLRPDARFQLVHATQSTPAEIAALGKTGAGIVLCPTTEANLGDGICDLPGWLAANVPISIGSDSQVGRNFTHELRSLEYSQRLRDRVRNVSATATQPITAHRLLTAALSGNARAAGLARWGLAAGARADLLVLDPHGEGLHGLPAPYSLDALIFASTAPVFREVHVANRRVLVSGHHPQEAAIAARFAGAMSELWAV